MPASRRNKGQTLPGSKVPSSRRVTERRPHRTRRGRGTRRNKELIAPDSKRRKCRRVTEARPHRTCKTPAPRDRRPPSPATPCKDSTTQHRLARVGRREPSSFSDRAAAPAVAASAVAAGADERGLTPKAPVKVPVFRLCSRLYFDVEQMECVESEMVTFTFICL